MTNSINPLLSSLPQLASESNWVLSLCDIPKQVLDIIKNGSFAKLEIMPHQISKALLHINGETFDVKLPDNFFSSPLNEGRVFDVRIGSNGQIFPLKATVVTKPEQSILPQKEGSIPQVDLPPLKIQEIITSNLQALKVPDSAIKQIVRDIMPLNVTLSSIGQTADADNLLKPLQDLLAKFAIAPDTQALPQLKEQIETLISSFIGRQISGEVVNKGNNLTMIKTPLGETFFASQIKLPPAEQVVLTITSQVPALKQELAFVDNLLAILHPDRAVSIKPETIATYPQLKNLAKVSSADLPLLTTVVNRLPFNNGHLLENIYNFYQAAEHQDLSKWISPKMLHLDHHSPKIKNLILEELNSFVSSALKETPSWRIIEMPLFDGNCFKPLKVAVKKEADEQKKSASKSSKMTRFIIETEFSKLGGFQFDGLSDLPKRQFDLIIRTTKALDHDFCVNVINLFKKSLYDLNYAGTIKINQKEAFIDFQPENTIKQGIYI